MARKLGVPDFDMHLDIAKKIFYLQGVDEDVLSFAEKVITAAEAINTKQKPLIFIHRTFALTDRKNSSRMTPLLCHEGF